MLASEIYRWDLPEGQWWVESPRYNRSKVLASSCWSWWAGTTQKFCRCRNWWRSYWRTIPGGNSEIQCWQTNISCANIGCRNQRKREFVQQTESRPSRGGFWLGDFVVVSSDSSKSICDRREKSNWEMSFKDMHKLHQMAFKKKSFFSLKSHAL